VSYEECHIKPHGGLHHVVDLHWRVNNRQVFAQALPWEDAYSRSVRVPRLSPFARALGPPHALLLACMHRAAHLSADGPEGDRLIWRFDIHLLAKAMTVGEWGEFVELCVAKKVRNIGMAALTATREAFATPIPVDVSEALWKESSGELSASYLHGNRRRLFLTNLRALATWRLRATLMRESLFPPAAYVLEKYSSHARWMLPWWYARRAAEGVWKMSRS